MSGHPRPPRIAMLASRTAVIGAIAMLAVSLWSLLSPASAATRAGDAQVITPADGSPGAAQPLRSGTSATAFSLHLPAGASCRGDSANDGYRVQSFMVPAGVDPATLTFGSSGPIPTGTGSSFRRPLFATTSDPVVNNQTAAATKPPGPGPIINIPAVNFAVFKAGDIPPGRYNLGIACTKGQPSSTQLETFWSTQLVLAGGLGGGMPPLSWTVPSALASGAASGAAGGPGSGGAAPSADASSPTVELVTTGAHARSTSAASRDQTSAGPVPSGAPPSLGFPLAGIASSLRLGTASAVALAVCAALLLAAARTAFVMNRRSPSVSAATP
jgi:hypothetical protein